MALNIAVIGLGQRSQHRALPAFSNSTILSLKCVCEPDRKLLSDFQQQHPQVACFSTVQDLLGWHTATTGVRLDCAYIAVTHFEYRNIVLRVLEAGIHVLKEKPASDDIEELEEFQSVARKHGVRILTACQRRFGRLPLQINRNLPLIGKLCFIEGTRKISISDLAEGWRAQQKFAKGGALNDIGWHLISTIIDSVGVHATPTVSSAALFITRPYQDYNCEDTAHLAFNLRGPGKGVECNLKVSRVGHEKIEEMIFTGSDGVLVVQNETVKLHLLFASGPRSLDISSAEDGDDDPFGAMLEFFCEEMKLSTPSKRYEEYSLEDRIVRQIIDFVYNIYTLQPHPTPLVDSLCKNSPPMLSNEYGSSRQLGKSMVWPQIGLDGEADVLKQLHDTISIYGTGGVFLEFETEFKTFLGRPDWSSLLHNSGTNALQALYYAANFQPGDEVIFPVYTFHATCSPAMHFGITPVFCDAGSDGNISPDALEVLFTAKTKAVVVTHMWGIPCDMFKIKKILSEYPRVLLFEDCSHAHGASISGQPVGTFGDGAAWSLQGQKIVSGGEGGIVVTKHDDYHFRQLLWGHYNKRCKVEIPNGHPLKIFALTGAGAKNRAHPLAIAIALNQLRQLSFFHANKVAIAARLASKLSKIPFLEVPEVFSTEGSDSDPAWYAFIVRFKQEQAPSGLTRELFVDLLLQEGLEDVDIPKSTGLLHCEPLFTNPETLLSHLYSRDVNRVLAALKEFPTAKCFYEQAIKLPVWVGANSQDIADFYTDTFLRVALSLKEQT